MASIPIAPSPGIYVPALLFFDENEELSRPAIESHVLRLAQGGVTGILVQGSNGEAQHLSHEERKLAIQITRETLDKNGFKDVIIIAGTGAQSTRETKKLCKDAAEAGAAYALVLTPSTWTSQMSKENILRFHREVADYSPIPTMVYNFPQVTAGQDLDSDIIGALGEHPNIVGTKLSCGNIGKLHRLASRFPPKQFAVFAGKSDLLVQGLLSGSAGCITALVNIIPKVHVHVYRLWEVGKLAEAMEIQAKLGHGDWAASRIGGIAGIKAVITESFQYGQPFVRGPLKARDGASLAGDSHYTTLTELIELENSL